MMPTTFEAGKLCPHSVLHLLPRDELGSENGVNPFWIWVY